MPKFKVKQGQHVEKDAGGKDVHYKKGDVVDSVWDLDKLFPEKFTRLSRRAAQEEEAVEEPVEEETPPPPPAPKPVSQPKPKPGKQKGEKPARKEKSPEKSDDEFFAEDE